MGYALSLHHLQCTYTLQPSMAYRNPNRDDMVRRRGPSRAPDLVHKEWFKSEHHEFVAPFRSLFHCCEATGAVSPTTVISHWAHKIPRPLMRCGRAKLEGTVENGYDSARASTRGRESRT